jgi:hypothetical protein
LKQAPQLPPGESCTAKASTSTRISRPRRGVIAPWTVWMDIAAFWGVSVHDLRKSCDFRDSGIVV